VKDSIPGRASGDYNIYQQNLKINKTIDEEVNISDSPKTFDQGRCILKWHFSQRLAGIGLITMSVTGSCR
jgi:hypothetical protein